MVRLEGVDAAVMDAADGDAGDERQVDVAASAPSTQNHPLCLWRVGGHHNRGRDAAQLRRQRHRRPVVAAGVRHHSLGRLLFAQRKDGVARAPELEGAATLEDLCLEVQRQTAKPRQRAAREDLRTINRKQCEDLRGERECRRRACCRALGGAPSFARHKDFPSVLQLL